MTLAERLSEYIAACFSGIWIESHEHPDALMEIGRLCQRENWRLACWDIERGLRMPGSDQPADVGANDPLAAIRSINALAGPDSSAVLVLANFHRFMQSAEIIEALAQQVVTGKQNRTFVIVLAPIVQIPVELEKLFVVVEHDLPSREQLLEIAQGIATEEGELPEDDELETVLDAAAGLTRYEVEGAFALSLVRHDRIAPQSVWSIKAQQLKKSGLVELHRGAERFEKLGGLQSLKSFCLRAVMLLGVPGTGKSAFSKALGAETGRPTLILDVGALMGSLVGSTEANIRQALKIADAVAPCVLMVDEVEKAFSGVGASGSTDSGVTARLFGTFLSWMNDHQSDVFLIATCNDIRKLPPEFSRAERFDGVWFLDLPSQEQRQTIWDLYFDVFELDRSQPLPRDEILR